MFQDIVIAFCFTDFHRNPRVINIEIKVFQDFGQTIFSLVAIASKGLYGD